MTENDDGYVFTEQDIDACWLYHKQYLVEILNGDYDIASARDDLLSCIGTKYDSRVGEANDPNQNSRLLGNLPTL